jgi:hypothetical protein
VKPLFGRTVERVSGYLRVLNFISHIEPGAAGSSDINLWRLRTGRLIRRWAKSRFAEPRVHTQRGSLGCPRWLQYVTTSAVLLASSALGAFAQDTPLNRPQEQRETTQERQSGQPDRPSLFKPLKAQPQEEAYHAITVRQRLRWFITNTIGPPHLAGGLVTSAFGTGVDRPREYGPHWGGFADRYGMRMTGIVVGNAIEVGAGELFREDPRYFPVPDRSFKLRMKNVIRLTFVARHNDGSFGPAYARYLGISGNNFLSNSWRVPSEANAHDAILRTGEGFAGRMVANAFEEFWPNVKQHLFHKRSDENQGQTSEK